MEKIDLDEKEVLEYVELMNDAIEGKTLNQLVTDAKAKAILPAITSTLVDKFIGDNIDVRNHEEVFYALGALVVRGMVIGIFLADSNQASLSGKPQEWN